MVVSVTDKVATARRFADLEAAANLEAELLMRHYLAGHVAAAVFSTVALLCSASLFAGRNYRHALHLTNEAELTKALEFAETVQGHVLAARAWRELLDEVHG